MTSLSTVASSRYWEARAQRFAASGWGLRAVCSYGMPAFYNIHIHLLQARALAPWLRVLPGTRVLEIGCGVGRWTRQLATGGARVTAVDLAPAMVAEAQRRAIAACVEWRCEFLVADAADLDLNRQFDRILCVTTLQHILQPDRLQRAVNTMRAHLARDGRLILLEAAPSSVRRRCDTAAFLARQESVYREAFARAGLRCVAITGVDPLPLKTWFLPFYQRLPRVIAVPVLLGITAVTLPFDLIFGRLLTRWSWHKVFVLEHAGRIE